MRVWPAVDLRQGAAVQLEQGDPGRLVARDADPLDVADRFVAAGATGLHVVDLDRAMGEGDNLAVVRELLDRDVDVQVAGGLRSDDAVAEVLDAGAFRAVVGTRAISDPDGLADLAEASPDRIAVALDIRRGEVVTHGWTQGSGLTLPEAVERIACPGLAAILCTHVDREGRARGVDPGPFRILTGHASVPVVAAGGITGLDDLDRLADTGVAEVVIGTSLYIGELDLKEVLDHVA